VTAQDTSGCGARSPRDVVPPDTGLVYLRMDTLNAPPPTRRRDTLIVDARNPVAFERPSAALKHAKRGPDLHPARRLRGQDRHPGPAHPADRRGTGCVQISAGGAGRCISQSVPSGRIMGITFRYVGSDQNSAMNILDSTCTISACPQPKASCRGSSCTAQLRATMNRQRGLLQRESGIFVFAGARPYVAQNRCFANHHFGLAPATPTRARISRATSAPNNMLSGILLFHHAEALDAGQHLLRQQHWGFVTTRSARPRRAGPTGGANTLQPNPRGAIMVTHEPLAEIGTIVPTLGLH